MTLVGFWIGCWLVCLFVVLVCLFVVLVGVWRSCVVGGCIEFVCIFICCGVVLGGVDYLFVCFGGFADNDSLCFIGLLG